MTGVARVLRTLLDGARIVSARGYLPLDRAGVEIVGGERRVRRLHQRALHAVTRIHPYLGHFYVRRVRWTNHAAGAAGRNCAPARCSAGCDDGTTCWCWRTARTGSTPTRRRGDGISEKRHERIEISRDQI